MAKLYWRVKRDGKWTWRPATIVHNYFNASVLKVFKQYDENKEEE